VDFKGVSFDISFREACQTLGEAVPEGVSLLSPELDPPGYIDYEGKAIQEVIGQLKSFPQVMIEINTPVSSPTVAWRTRELMEYARVKGVDEQVAVHVRMVSGDVKLAIDCGAKRIFLLGRTKASAENNSVAVEELLDNLGNIARVSQNRDVSFRVSVEHASEQSLKWVEEFINGLGKINLLRLGSVEGLGLPDTKGVGTKDRYRDLLNKVGKFMIKGGLEMYIHLHNDSGRATENCKFISNWLIDKGIGCCLEVTFKDYPGERNGIRPYLEDVGGLGRIIRAKEVIKGPSWVKKGQKAEDAKRGHVAGIHTHVMESYSNTDSRYPSPGLYSIMGSGNILFLQGLVCKRVSGGKVLKSAALVGREYAAQYGNKKQKYALALARLAEAEPDYLLKLANSFGTLSGWLENPPPDLKGLDGKIRKYLG
jgi:hypothetical protein